MSQIKSYTTNFSMKIPEFNIATWHDAMEYNFTLIDALLGNFFEANKFKGPWLIVTGYQADDIVYITDEEDQYVGKIFKVLQDHVSGNTKFETFYTEHPEYYEEYADLNGVLNYFTIAKDYAIKMDGKVVENGVPIDYSAKYYATEAKDWATLASEHETNAFNYKTDAESAKDSAESYATSAQGYMNTAKQHRDDAEDFKNQASNSANNAELAKTDAQSAATSASSSQTGAETAEQNAQGYAINASNSATAAHNSEVAAQTARDEAKVWAVGIPAEPDEHSAKYWAQLASTFARQVDWEETDQTSVAYIKNKPMQLLQQITTNQNNIGNLNNLTTSNKNDLVSAINSEKARAIGIEDELGSDIISERNMRIAQDNALYGEIVAEEYRATSIERELETKINNEITRATQVEGTLQPKIANDNKLDANLVDDSDSTNKFVTDEDKTLWNNALQPSALNGYATEQYVDNIVGDIETLLHNINSGS